MSSYMRHLNQARYDRLLLSLQTADDKYAMARLRSAGGPTAGRHLVEPPTDDWAVFTDTEWTLSLRHRAGLDVCSPAAMICWIPA